MYGKHQRLEKADFSSACKYFFYRITLNIVCHKDSMQNYN